MKVAILGSGNGACAMAFEWARAGHDIYMFDFPQFDRQIKAIKAPGFIGIKAQTQLDYRYYNEDAGFGLVLWLDLADRLGLQVPNMRAMLQIVSSIMGRDYKAEKARTLETLGLVATLWMSL